MDEIRYFRYGEKETEYLKQRDPVLGRAIDQIGHIYRPVIPDMFQALLNSIIGQQISTKAQETIWKRMLEQFSPVTPEHIGGISAGELQTCGISMRKAEYIKLIAETVLDGSLDLSELHKLTDDEVCSRLSRIKGIGVWTAQMLMTFSMERMDIISWDDLAIHRGLRMLYHHRKITPQLFAKYKRRYSPYATVASLYLWGIAGGTYSGFVDYAPKTEAQKKRKVKKRSPGNENG